MTAATVPTDRDLVLGARGGEVTDLGLLLGRHRAGMHAVAISMLGWGPEAEDVVQDASLVALQKLGALRDPGAVGAWLQGITRNTARMRLRSQPRETPLDPEVESIPARQPRPDQVLDEHALRDWVWSAVETLSEPLQTVVLLRYFSEAGSYEQVAAVCGIPVGTVRSRLSQARTKLLAALDERASAAHPDVAALTARRTQAAEHLLSAAETGRFGDALAEAAAPDMLLRGPQGQQAHGRDTLVWFMNADLEAGVRQRLGHVTASRRLTLLECDLLSPASDPQHCPPAVLWLIRSEQERITAIRLYHPKPAGGDPPVS